MLQFNRELVLVSLTSGAISIASYIFLKRLLCCGQKNTVKQEQSKIYEEKALLDQYMLFNYAEAKDFLLFDLKEYSNFQNCISFPRNVALLCRDYCPDIFFGENVIIFVNLEIKRFFKLNILNFFRFIRAQL